MKSATYAPCLLFLLGSTNRAVVVAGDRSFHLRGTLSMEKAGERLEGAVDSAPTGEVGRTDARTDPTEANPTVTAPAFGMCREDADCRDGCRCMQGSFVMGLCHCPPPHFADGDARTLPTERANGTDARTSNDTRTDPAETGRTFPTPPTRSTNGTDDTRTDPAETGPTLPALAGCEDDSECEGDGCWCSHVYNGMDGMSRGVCVCSEIPDAPTVPTVPTRETDPSQSDTTHPFQICQVDHEDSECDDECECRKLFLSVGMCVCSGGWTPPTAPNETNVTLPEGMCLNESDCDDGFGCQELALGMGFCFPMSSAGGAESNVTLPEGMCFNESDCDDGDGCQKLGLDMGFCFPMSSTGGADVPTLPDESNVTLPEEMCVLDSDCDDGFGCQELALGMGVCVQVASANATPPTRIY